MINLRSQFLLALSLLFLACGDIPQAPELVPNHVPVIDGQMLLLLINSSPDTVLAFNYSKTPIRPSTTENIDSAWGANLLKKILNPGHLDTIMSFTEESYTKYNSYRYSLKSGYTHSATLIVESFNDGKDIPVIID